MVAELLARVSKRFETKLYHGALLALIPVDLGLSLLAKRSYRAYRGWYRYNALTNPLFDQGEPGTESDYDTTALAQLRDEGYAFLREAYPRPELDEARTFVEQLYARSAAERARASSRPLSSEWWVDGVRHEYHPRTGNMRFYFTLDQRATLPRAIADFMDRASLHRLAEELFGARRVRGAEPYMMAEVLEPTDHAETWHVDEFRETVKAFLYLDDVTDAQGPLRVIPRSHKESPEQHDIFYRICRGGLAGAYFSPEADRALDARGRTLPAPANTVCLFDTRALHAGSRCVEGRRLVLVTGYRPLFTTRLNPRLFRDPAPAKLHWQRELDDGARGA